VISNFNLFNLYQKKHKIFPETVNIGGGIYAINADFRNILRIFAMLGDENIPAEKKLAKTREWFFEFYEDQDIDIKGGGAAEGFFDFTNPRRCGGTPF